MMSVIFAMDNFDMLIIDTEHFNLTISKKVSNIWQEYRQLKPMDPEAFGVLIGDKDFEIERYGLVEITVPQKEDRCSRMSFTLRDPEHQRTVDQLYENSEGQLIYFGTWHTHPEKILTLHTPILGTGIIVNYGTQDRGFFHNNWYGNKCPLLF
jgi:integrative and conjugative element protein (TIGR02256 family)